MTTIVAPPWEEQPTEGGIADAPSDGRTYGRKDATWAEVASVGGDAAGFEALRRTYADAGLTLIDGSFETGGTLSSATDVLLHNATAKAYAWTGAFPKVVVAGTDPAAVAGFVPRSDVLLRSELGRLSVHTVAELQNLTNSDVGKRVQWMGYYNGSDGGGNFGVVKSGAHTHDGFKIFSISASLYVEANLVGRNKVSVLLAGARRDGNQATPSHAAIQVVLNHCKITGSVCYFPAGVYEIASTLIVECSVCGDGVGSVINQRATGADAMHISVDSFLTGMTYEDVKIFCWPSAGHVINVPFGLSGCRFTNVHLEQYNPAKSVFYHHPSPAGGMYDCLFSGGVWTLGVDSSRSVSGFDVSVPGTLFNENEFSGIRLYNSAGTTKLNAKPWFSIKNTGSQVWLTNNRFKGLNFEVCHGGGVYIEDCKQCEFSGLSFWDTDTHAGDGIKLGQGAGLQPIANKISLLQRHSGAPVASDVYDIDCSLATIQAGQWLEGITSSSWIL